MNLTGRLLLPPLAAGLAALGVLALVPLPAEAASARALVLAAGLLPAVLIVGSLAATLRLRLGARLRRLVATLGGPPADARGRDELDALAGGLDAMAEALAACRAALARARSDHGDAQLALDAAEERYSLALRGTGDATWDWDLERGALRLSPRWRALVGADADWQPDPDAWQACMPAADAAAFAAGLEAHLAGRTPCFEHSHRVRHRDGSLRWIYSRGAALRRAGGKPYRLIGLDTDVTAQRRIETVLKAIVDGTSQASGEAFFREMVRHFAGALDVPVAFVTECADRPATRLRTLAFWNDGAFADNFEYALTGTPCAEVVGEGRMCIHPAGVGGRYPVEAGFEGYLGVPIFGSDGQVIGHLAFLARRQLADEMLMESVYRVFGARAAVEIERRACAEELARLRARLGGADPAGCAAAV